MRKIFPLYIVIFIGFVGFSMTIPMFTSMLLNPAVEIPLDHLSMTVKIILVGAILAMYPFGQFFGSPILGAISDRFGRKPILMISLTVTTLCYVAIALSLQFFSMTALFIFLFIAGFSEGNVVIAQSSIADITPPHLRWQRFGYIYTAGGLGFVIGPLFGGRLADPNFVSWFNYATPFWALVIVLILLIIWIYTMYSETHDESKRVHVSYIKALTNIRNLFTTKNLRVFYLANFFLYLSIFGFLRVYPMYLVLKYDMSIGTLSTYVAYVALPVILVNTFLIKYLCKLMSARKLASFSAILMGLGQLLIFIFKAEVSLWFTLFFTSFFVAIALSASATIISTNAPDLKQGEALGNNQSLLVGAQAFAGLLGGILVTVFLQFPLIVCAIFAFIASFILFTRTGDTREIIEGDPK